MRAVGGWQGRGLGEPPFPRRKWSKVLRSNVKTKKGKKGTGYEAGKNKREESPKKGEKKKTSRSKGERSGTPKGKGRGKGKETYI